MTLKKKVHFNKSSKNGKILEISQKNEGNLGYFRAFYWNVPLKHRMTSKMAPKMAAKCKMSHGKRSQNCFLTTPWSIKILEKAKNKNTKTKAIIWRPNSCCNSISKKCPADKIRNKMSETPTEMAAVCKFPQHHNFCAKKFIMWTLWALQNNWIFVYFDGLFTAKAAWRRAIFIGNLSHQTSLWALKKYSIYFRFLTIYEQFRSVSEPF